MPRTPVPEATLLSAYDPHIRYEFQMYLVMRVRLTELAEDGSGMRNAAYESLATHIRNLIDFFYAPPESRDKDTDDIFALDFDSRWTPGKWPEALAAARNAIINKQIAHLTYTRLQLPPEGEKNWRYEEVFAALDKLIPDFLDRAKKRFSNIVIDDWVYAVGKKGVGASIPTGPSQLLNTSNVASCELSIVTLKPGVVLLTPPDEKKNP